MSDVPQTPLGRALRRIAAGERLSSLDVPVLEDAADEIDELTHVLRGAARAAVYPAPSAARPKEPE